MDNIVGGLNKINVTLEDGDSQGQDSEIAMNTEGQHQNQHGGHLDDLSSDSVMADDESDSSSSNVESIYYDSPSSSDPGPSAHSSDGENATDQNRSNLNVHPDQDQPGTSRSEMGTKSVKVTNISSSEKPVQAQAIRKSIFSSTVRRPWKESQNITSSSDSEAAANSDSVELLSGCSTETGNKRQKRVLENKSKSKKSAHNFFHSFRHRSRLFDDSQDEVNNVQVDPEKQQLSGDTGRDDLDDGPNGSKSRVDRKEMFCDSFFHFFKGDQSDPAYQAIPAKKMYCIVCELFFPSNQVKLFVAHNRRHYALEFFQCPSCSEGFTTLKRCCDHEVEVHGATIREFTGTLVSEEPEPERSVDENEPEFVVTIENDEPSKVAASGSGSESESGSKSDSTSGSSCAISNARQEILDWDDIRFVPSTALTTYDGPTVPDKLNCFDVEVEFGICSRPGIDEDGDSISVKEQILQIEKEFREKEKERIREQEQRRSQFQKKET